MKTYTAYIQWDPETKLYTGFFPGLIGTESIARTRRELDSALREALGEALKDSGTRRRRRKARPAGYGSIDITF